MIIVNFSTANYANGQARLKQSLIGCNHKTLFFTDYNEINSPTHQESNYEFKIHAMEAARKLDSVVLWLDSSLWLTGDISKVEAVIKKDGYILQDSGVRLGKWLDEKSRKYFQFTEGDMPMFEGGMVGIDFDNAVGKEFFRQWKKAAKDGQFTGSWDNHRHDMACGSVIAVRLAMNFQPNRKYFAYIGEAWGEPPQDVVFHCRGIN